MELYGVKHLSLLSQGMSNLHTILATRGCAELLCMPGIVVNLFFDALVAFVKKKKKKKKNGVSIYTGEQVAL